MDIVIMLIVVVVISVTFIVAYAYQRRVIDSLLRENRLITRSVFNKAAVPVIDEDDQDAEGCLSEWTDELGRTHFSDGTVSYKGQRIPEGDPRLAEDGEDLEG